MITYKVVFVSKTSTNEITLGCRTSFKMATSEAVLSLSETERVVLSMILAASL